MSRRMRILLLSIILGHLGSAQTPLPPQGHGCFGGGSGSSAVSFQRLRVDFNLPVGPTIQTPALTTPGLGGTISLTNAGTLIVGGANGQSSISVSNTAELWSLRL